MTSDENKKMIARQLSAFSSTSVAEFDRLTDDLVATNYVLHDPSMPDFDTGPEAVKQFMHAMIENTPDVHIVIEDMFAEGDKVATRFTVHATNTSTGKPEVMEVMVISRFSNGKCVEEWELGVQMPTPI